VKNKVASVSCGVVVNRNAEFILLYLHM